MSEKISVGSNENDPNYKTVPSISRRSMLRILGWGGVSVVFGSKINWPEKVVATTREDPISKPEDKPELQTEYYFTSPSKLRAFFDKQTEQKYGVKPSELLNASAEYLKKKIDQFPDRPLHWQVVVPDQVRADIESSLEEFGVSSVEEWFDAHVLMFKDMLADAGLKKPDIRLSPIVYVTDGMVEEVEVLYFKHQLEQGQTSENWRQILLNDEHLINQPMGADVIIFFESRDGYPHHSMALKKVFVPSLGKEVMLDGGALHEWFGHLMIMHWGDLYRFNEKNVFSDPGYHLQNIYAFGNDIMSNSTAFNLSPMSALWQELADPTFRSIQNDVMLLEYFFNPYKPEGEKLYPSNVFPRKTVVEFFLQNGSPITRDMPDAENAISNLWLIGKEMDVLKSNPVLFDPQMKEGYSPYRSEITISPEVISMMRPDLVDIETKQIIARHFALTVYGLIFPIPVGIINIMAAQKIYGDPKNPLRSDQDVKLNIYFRYHPKERVLPKDIHVYTLRGCPLRAENNNDPRLEHILAECSIGGNNYVIWTTEPIDDVDSLPMEAGSPANKLTYNTYASMVGYAAK